MKIEKDSSGNPIRSLKELCSDQRTQLEILKGDIKEMSLHPDIAMKSPDVAENLKLAFRHLEDARMRLGKTIQAWTAASPTMGIDVNSHKSL